MDNYPTLGAFTDERGAWFTVEMCEKTRLSQVVKLGDAAFKSKVPLQAVGRRRGRRRDFAFAAEHPQAPPHK